MRPPRLTEPGFSKWNRVRRKLGWHDLIALLHEDLAAAFPYPFEFRRWISNPTANLSDADAKDLIDEAIASPEADPARTDVTAFLRFAARAANLPSGGALSELPKVQPGHRVLELPGSGGRIAASQALQHDVSFHDAFTFVADTDAERVLIGLSAVELRSNEPRVVTSDQARADLAKGTRFDRVFGLSGYARAQDLAAECRGMEVRWA